MVGTNPRVRGLAHSMGFILFVSALGAILLVVRPWASGSRAEGKKAVSIPAANSKPGAQAKLDLSGADAAKGNRWKGVYAQLPLSFEANEGQSAPQVKFLSRGVGYALFLTGREAVLEVSGGNSKGLATGGRARTASAVHLELAGSNPHATVDGLEPLPGKSNYFVGNNPDKWRTSVTNYARVLYHDVYPGIDLVYYGNQRQLEYDFVVSPGADPAAINLRVRGPENVSLDAEGNLVLVVGGSRVLFHQPVIYQGSGAARRQVEGGYVVAQSPRSGAAQNVQDVRFEVGAYDRTQPLVIDPTLSLTYSTYLGGSSSDVAYALAVDSSGNAYLTGETLSVNFPAKSPEQPDCDNNSSATTCNGDAFVAKINSTGSALVYSTYLGGSGPDSGTAVAVDSSGNAYVTGGTFSTDFPTTAGVFQSTGTFGVGDAFVTELNSTGSGLVFSTYLGGSSINGSTVINNCGGIVTGIGNCGTAIALGTSNNIYVAGNTEASDFPLQDAYQSKLNGTSNAFVTELPQGGKTLTYSTYLGGAGVDLANAIAVSAPNVYVAGQTTSNNFPTASAYQSSYGGQGDAFITKLVFSGASITLGYSTFLGGTSADAAYGIAVVNGSPYVTGETQSSNFPTQNAFQTKLAGGSPQAAFVAKLSSIGSTLDYSTYLGGSGTDTGYAIAVDPSGVAHVVGSTTSMNFPTLNPIQTAYNGNTDAFLTRLNPQGCGLEFSTYIGGSATDVARGVATDSSGDTYLTGYTGSNNFPTQSPFQADTGGNNDAFLAKVPAVSGGVPSVCFSPSALTFSAQAATTTSAAMNVTLTNEGSAALAITSIAATGPFAETNTCGSSVAAAANCTMSVTFSPTQAGQLSGTVTVTDNVGGASSATQTVELQGVGTDFALAMTPATASVTAGQSETFMLTLTPSQDFTDEVTLSCNTSPAIPAGSCTVSPTSITPTTTSNYTATVTVTTTAKSLAPPGLGNRQPPLTWLLALLAAGLLAAGAWARRTGARRLSFRVVAIAGIALLVFAWFGCGVSNGPATFTPPGNYSVAITGVDGTLNHVIHSVLTVN